MSTVQVSHTTSTVEVSATRPRVEVGTPSIVTHAAISWRDAADSHPIGAITGLLPLPTADGSRWAVSHPGGAVAPAWSNKAAWKDQANTWTQQQLFDGGSAAAPGIAVGVVGDGWGRYAGSVLSGSVNGIERFRFQPDRLIINANAAAWYSPGIANLGLNGLTFYGADGVAIGLGGSAVANDVRFIGRRANGTALVPTALGAGEDILNIQASGYDGSAFTGDRARLTAEAAEAWGPAAHGTRWRMYTCANGATALAEGWQLDHDGQSQHASGTAGRPSISFLSDTDTGFWRSASNTISTSIAGIERHQVDSSRNRVNANALAFASLTSMGVPGFEVYGADATSAGLGVATYGNRAIFTSRRTNGTESAKTAVLANDLFYDFSCQGYDGTAYSGGRALIYAAANENWTTTAHGTRWQFYATPNGATGAVEVLRVDGSVVATYKPLSVTGNISARAASAQDGIALLGRSGGTSSYLVTLTPATLGASITQTLPAVAGTFCVNAAVPATATSAGVVGQVAADATHLYTCVAANTWRRVAHASW